MSWEEGFETIGLTRRYDGSVRAESGPVEPTKLPASSRSVSLRVLERSLKLKSTVASDMTVRSGDRAERGDEKGAPRRGGPAMRQTCR